jgi:putative sigma-54 modulation protein
MNVSYKGLTQELAPKVQAKLDAKFAKLSKLLEQRGERSAHVVVTQERHLTRAEVTIRFYDHQLVAEGSDGDLVTALSDALLKLEQQAVKEKSRWREKHRRGGLGKEAAEEAAAEVPVAAGPRIFRVNHHEKRKPMTLDEAILMMDENRDYFVYRDAERECLSVLVRRRDGNFDLIES